MRNIKYVIPILGAMLLGFISCQNQHVSIFVSTDGNDKNIGSKESPLATLNAARDVVRASNGKIKTIFLREGTYHLFSTFELSAYDSGTKEFPITYKAFNNEKVVLNGGIKISYDDIQAIEDHDVLNRLLPGVINKVYEVDLQKLNVHHFGEYGPRGFARPYKTAPNELFIDGKPQNIARWPNPGESPIKIGDLIDKGSIPRSGDFSGRGATFKWNSERPKRWSSAKDVFIAGLFNNGYADDVIKLAEINQEKQTFTTEQPHLYGFDNKHPWNTWIAYNLLEEVDLPGEYFVDEKSKKLFFYRDGRLNEDLDIQLSILEEPMVALENASFIRFEGIDFECTRGMAVYIEGGEACILEKCDFKNIGLVAVCIGKGIKGDKQLRHDFTGEEVSREIGSLYTHLYQNPAFDRKAGKNHGIISCEISNIGSGAIVMGGGNRLALEPGGNYVRNCHIHDFNRLEKTYRSAVNIDGVGNLIQHCLIHDAPGTAIYLHGNDHIIEYNEVHHVMMDGDDQGAYYLGRDPSEFNNVVRYNYWHHIGISPTAHSTMALYYDDGSCGNVAYGNVFYKAGNRTAILIGGGKYNKISNNIFIDCKLGIHTDNRQQNWAKKLLEEGDLFDTRLSLFNITNPPYSTKYPELANYWNDNPAEPANSITKNLFYKTEKLINQRFEKTIIEDNWQTEKDPGFVDFENNNYRLKEDAEVFAKIPGFQNIPFEEIGLLKIK
ncbi:right-handed parallel beta-helix repeat-containing protein [Mariniphaga sediminis]|uniref:right-handed parallel beta-helix repeat-containing protein n=1 Tax=Mariniphaga sediminis TaxID=1628158 RepID=UPI0035693591